MEERHKDEKMMTVSFFGVTIPLSLLKKSGGNSNTQKTTYVGDRCAYFC